jgi:glycosyltransferase involved in cell wall biosynthesis
MSIPFSIIVISLNPGEKLLQTLHSIFSQTYENYEVIWKDGGSTDHSVEKGVEQYGTDQRLKMFRQKDQGIYDAMNQALEKVQGRFVLFLNCGDTFYSRDVLEQAALYGEKLSDETNVIMYGDTYKEISEGVQYASPVINGFTCYRNIPCHQSCFTERELFRDRGFQTAYHVRGDYDHFLWCYFVKKAHMQYLGITVASYEGGGYSESREHKGLDKREHHEITGKYMSLGKRIKYKGILVLTLAPVRKKLAESKRFSKLYETCKKRAMYGK